MLSKSQFDLLFCALKKAGEPLTQRDLCSMTGLSLGKVNSVIRELSSEHLLDENLRVSPEGLLALEPYKVKNAVIMAAGMSTRFAPLSYEKPKALLNVRGEILIERQIRQLKEAGICDITLVVGYMKEKMFYLEDKFGVKIAVNEDYFRFNNPSSLILVADRLDNTYICSSDNYFTENVFEPYVYSAYYSAVYTPGKTDEYCIFCNGRGLITDVKIGGEASWYMLGHVYFSREFSRKFVHILRDEYEQPLTKTHLWEDLYIRHISELEMYIRKYDSSVVLEFDSLDELRQFDDRYVMNADSAIFSNICRVLGCADRDITGIVPIKSGLTNTSFRFCCGGKLYVYRHPGAGTKAYINRASEACSMQAAKKLGLDDTFIWIDEKEGWKISHFISGAVELDYHNPAHVSGALRMMRTLHDSGIRSKWTFDIWKGIAGFRQKTQENDGADSEDLKAMSETMKRVRRFADADRVPQCLCHGDCYAPNFLIDPQGKMYLIDWEYSGMADPACDMGTFLACSDYTPEEADRVIAEYLGRTPSREELRHFLAYAAILSYYWFLWAIYQNSLGKTVGEFLYIWYRYTKQYSRRALELYEGTQEK